MSKSVSDYMEYLEYQKTQEYNSLTYPSSLIPIADNPFCLSPPLILSKGSLRTFRGPDALYEANRAIQAWFRGKETPPVAPAAGIFNQRRKCAGVIQS